MSDLEKRKLFAKVQSHAFANLPRAKLQTTNLHLDQRVYAAGEVIGPKRQKIVAERPSVLVFADDEPNANFSHACRYILYDAKSGEFVKEVPAQFPPFVKAKPKTLKAFHAPVRFLETPILFKIRPIFRCPIIFPDGRRYAILWSGMSNKRHLNDMEFLYRTLIDEYGFDPDNIFSYSYDGTLNTMDGVQTLWPGDSSAYRIKINGNGTRNSFESAINGLKTKLAARDLLLIHTNNHGGYDGSPGTANLCTYPDWDGYYATDFANKLAELPKFKQLIVMMEQCHSGGFNSSILSKSPATATSVASACIEPNNSYVSADGNWDPFARDWVAAEAGANPFGGALAHNADTDGDGKIEAEEAFNYANSIKHPWDTPIFNESSAAGGDIALGQRYIVWWWWCWIFKEILEPYRIKLPPEKYYAKLRTIQPELAKMVESLDATSEALQKEYSAKIKKVVTSTFGKR